jgi:hypothetical protein
VVPKYYGGAEELMEWITQLDHVVRRHPDLLGELGYVVPLRFEKDAKIWFNALDPAWQQYMMQDWRLMKENMARYFWNPHWLNKLRSKAHQAKYREPGKDTESETPSQYIMRKKDLLDAAYSFTDPEAIEEVLRGAPQQWKTLLSTATLVTWMDFMFKVKEIEELLQDFKHSKSDSYKSSDFNKAFETWRHERREKKKEKKKARVHAVNTPSSGKKPHVPNYPPDDKNVSKVTPASQGKRPCWHCGSGNHWDNHCKYARKNATKARVHFASIEGDELREQEEYEAAEAGFSSSSESSEEDDESDSEDF